jgi:hypothetical protein
VAYTRLSIVFPYYRNERMLARQHLAWAEWPDFLRLQVEVIVVDDGSPEPAAPILENWHDAPRSPKISVYRIAEDRPWHQHGARNLGAHVAEGPFLLMTDMDHVIPADTLAAALDFDRLDAAMTFSRRDAPAGEPWKADHWSTMEPTRRPDGSLKPHVNSFVIAKETYWHVGGYDEDFCGVYGTDGMFRRRLWSQVEQVFCPLPLIRVDRKVIPDASTTTYDRGVKGERQYPKTERQLWKERNGRGSKIATLQFEWGKVL